MKYVLDGAKAREADESYSLIPHSGLYVGKITQAKQVFSSSKTEGIEFTFECSLGKAVSTIWTAKQNGDLTFGYNLVLALMTCLRKKQIIPVEMMVKEYDLTQRKTIEKQGIVYPDLCGDVAIIFQIEEYLKRNGDIGKQANIKHFFDAESLLSASEILDQIVEPIKVHQLKERYKDVLLPLTQEQTNAVAPSYASTQGGYGHNTQTQSKYGDNAVDIVIDDDEIPF
ncbi:MAG: hypothetical protein EOL93_00550 [Epsilonproteobacteria bacterium]|nr:hypothetical protein [Campylobacterota bacterium]